MENFEKFRGEQTKERIEKTVDELLEEVVKLEFNDSDYDVKIEDLKRKIIERQIQDKEEAVTEILEEANERLEGLMEKIVGETNTDQFNILVKELMRLFDDLVNNDSKDNEKISNLRDKVHEHIMKAVTKLGKFKKG